MLDLLFIEKTLQRLKVGMSRFYVFFVELVLPSHTSIEI